MNKLYNVNAKYSSICKCCGDVFDGDFDRSLVYCQDCFNKKQSKQRFLKVNLDRLVDEVKKELDNE